MRARPAFFPLSLPLAPVAALGLRTVQVKRPAGFYLISENLLLKESHKLQCSISYDKYVGRVDGHFVE